MEEKKLTAEEIREAVKKMGLNTFREEDKRVILRGEDYVALVYRIDDQNKIIDNQKAEIERLTEAMSDFRQEVITLNIEKLELQKQVDELKKESARLDKNVKWFQEKIENGELVSEKAVKDTAKEILILLKSSEYVDSEKTISIWAINKIFKEHYGVEVE